MAKTNRISIKKEIYEWAISESQKDLPVIRDKFKLIDLWMAHEQFPTFKQLEHFAHFLKVPFGYMFLEEPPTLDAIESEYRTLGNKIPLMSKELKDVIYDMSRKKDWLSEYRKDNGWDKINDSLKAISRNESTLNVELRTFLELGEYWYQDQKDYATAFGFLREKLESKGIIVMQNGIVGYDTHRKLDIREFRGFLLFDEYAPLIFINSRDSLAGKIFTLIHELIHIIFREDDIFVEVRAETKVNRLTADFLMPDAHLHERWRDDVDPLRQIEILSHVFNVSKLALAIKLARLRLIDQSLVDLIEERSVAEFNKKKKGTGGGDFWKVFASRNSRRFVEALVTGAESGDISFSDAFQLLGLKAKTYDKLKKEMTAYGWMLPA